MRTIALCALALSMAGCGGLQLPGINLGAAFGDPDVLCTLDGKAQLVQPGPGGFATIRPLPKVDASCPKKN